MAQGKQNLAIMDLMSLARFIIFPEDDLNIAGLLLSPIIGLDDEELAELSLNRTCSIWENIKGKKEKLYAELSEFITLYKNS